MTYASDFKLNTLSHQISGLIETDALSLLANAFNGEVVFSTSFNLEDQVITHFIQTKNIPVEIFTIDTGRLFEETYNVWNLTNNKYSINIKTYYPQFNSLQEFVETNGPNAFHESVQLRKECCYIRKIEPLQRALKGKTILITGLREEHLPEGRHVDQLEWDAINQVTKFHPLLHWTSEQVSSFIFENNIPYNALHNKGFVNIGCAPCTRAIKPGEGYSAANWWWEKKPKTEKTNAVYALD
jgi:phosphoadenosine phosphosulfate reductase